MRGYDGDKRMAGRKRHILMDSKELVLAVSVHVADPHDRHGSNPCWTSNVNGGCLGRRY